MSHVIDIEEYFPGYDVTDQGIALIALLMKEAGLTPDDMRQMGPKKSAAALFRAQERLRQAMRICDRKPTCDSGGNFPPKDVG